MRAMAGAGGGGSGLDLWSFAGALPDGTELVEREILPDGRPVRWARLDGAGGEELVGRLRAAREGLLERTSEELVEVLGAVGARFLDPGDPVREEALALLPATAHVSSPMAEAILDGMALDWTAGRLGALLDMELDGGAALDGFVSRAGRPGRVRALGRELSVHVVSGSVPGVAVTSMLRALLVRSAVLLKPGRGDEALALLFRRGLAEGDPGVAAAAAVAYWPGGAGEPLEAVALNSADLAVVYGDDEAVRSVRSRVRATTPVVAYPHRVSFAVVGGEGPSASLEAAAREAARAVALFEQRGCVSPHLIYVLGRPEEAESFAGRLSHALAEVEASLPSAARGGALLASLHQQRGAGEVLAAAGLGRIWSGAGASWTVVLERDPTFLPSCLGRFVRVKPAASVAALLAAVRPWRRDLQTVGVAGLVASLPELAEGLARLGAVRLAPLGSVSFPPAWWHHDGEGALSALARWTDLEE